MKAADSGLYRWYNDYRLPEHIGEGQITVRLHQNQADRKRKFNRTENVQLIPPSDPDFPRLYGRRNDSNRSTAPWRTPCSSGGLTASDGAVSKSRCSAGL